MQPHLPYPHIYRVTGLRRQIFSAEVLPAIVGTVIYHIQPGVCIGVDISHVHNFFAAPRLNRVPTKPLRVEFMEEALF